MSDIVDRANDEADAWTAEKIRQIIKDTKSQVPNDTADCIDCDEPIGVARKQAMPSAVRCIGCQTALESKK